MMLFQPALTIIYVGNCHIYLRYTNWQRNLPMGRQTSSVGDE